MIVHISMAKYKDFAQGRSREENIKQGKRLTEALKERIPSIRKLEVGIDILKRPDDYDVVSYSEYDDMDQVKATTAHPAHEELVAFLKEVAEVSHAVTYEVTR